MIKIKKYFVLLFFISLTVTMSSTSYASYPEAKLLVDLENEIPKVIHQYVNAINNQNWDLFVKSYSPKKQDDYINFPSQYQIENQTGILSVESIQIYEAKKLPSTHILEIEPLIEIDDSKYDNIGYY